MPRARRPSKHSRQYPLDLDGHERLNTSRLLGCLPPCGVAETEFREVPDCRFLGASP